MQKKLNIFEIECCGSILNINYTQHIKNEEILTKINEKPIYNKIIDR